MSRAMLTLWTVRDRQKALDWVRRCQDGTRLTFQGPVRSLPQNARMWVMLTCLAEQVEWYGQKLTADDWKDVLSASLRKARVVPGLDGGFVPLGMRTSSMSKAEMTALIELIEAFAAERGVVFPWHGGGNEG